MSNLKEQLEALAKEHYCNKARRLFQGTLAKETFAEDEIRTFNAGAAAAIKLIVDEMERWCNTERRWDEYTPGGMKVANVSTRGYDHEADTLLNHIKQFTNSVTEVEDK